MTFDPFRQTNVKIMVGNRIYEYVNTIAVLYDLRAQKYVAINIRDEKFNSKECVIIK